MRKTTFRVINSLYLKSCLTGLNIMESSTTQLTLLWQWDQIPKREETQLLLYIRLYKCCSVCGLVHSLFMCSLTRSAPVHASALIAVVLHRKVSSQIEQKTMNEELLTSSRHHLFVLLLLFFFCCSDWLGDSFLPEHTCISDSLRCAKQL